MTLKCVANVGHVCMYDSVNVRIILCNDSERRVLGGEPASAKMACVGVGGV